MSTDAPNGDDRPTDRERSDDERSSGGTDSGSGTGRRHRSGRRVRRRRRIIGWSVAGVVVVLVAAVAWVGIRALLAKNELEAAVPLATRIADSIGDGDTTAARETSRQLVSHTSSAASLTSDPIWRAFEVLPGVGDDLRAVRDVAGSVDGLARDAVTPVLALTETFGLDQFRPVDGSLPVQPLIDAQPTVAAAAAATRNARDRVHAIDTSDTIGPVTDAVDRLTGLVDTASAATDAADRAVRLLPLVLGSDRPRNYLLLFQNSAEPRASGGIPSAMALVHTENGAISLAQQASAEDFPKRDEPIIDLPTETESLYGDITGRSSRTPARWRKPGGGTPSARRSTASSRSTRPRSATF